MASTVTDILSAAAQMETDESVSKLDQLNKKIGDLKLEIFEITKSKYTDFLPNLTTAEELSNRVENMVEEMTAVKWNIQAKLQNQLNMSTGEFQHLSDQLQQTCGSLSILDKLVQLYTSLESASTAFNQKEYLKAADSILRSQELMSVPVYCQENSINILVAIQTEIKVQREKLLFDLNEAWKEHIIWTVCKENADGMSKYEIKFVFKDDQKMLEDIVCSMEKLGVLDSKLKRFGENLLTYIMNPIVRNTVKVSKKSIGNSRFLIVEASNSKHVSKPCEIFALIEKVMSFLQENFLHVSVPLEGIMLTEQLGSIIGGKFLQLIIKECLLHAIPNNNKDLEKFTEDIKFIKEFEKRLMDLHFISDENAEIKDYIQNVDILFANKKCQEILEVARKLIMSDDHTTVVCDGKLLKELPFLNADKPVRKKEKLGILSNEKQLSDNTFRLPKCYINVTVQNLMSLAYKTLHEAVESSAPCAVQLFYTVRNIFELFCNVFPTYHRQSLETLPQSTAIYHNNCMYIAHHLLTMGPQFNKNLPIPLKTGAGTFVDLVQKFRRIGTEAFVQQMARQQDYLLECLVGAEGFNEISKAEKYFSSERAIRQVLHQLNHLQKIWQKVLPVHIYNKAIGTLLNSVLVDTMNSITSLEDISADDASQLYSLLCFLENEARSLFENNDIEIDLLQVELEQNVSKWRKFKELTLMLNANLQEISDRWSDGKGVLALEFSSNEVKQLIRALFQNTERRAALLARIR